MSPDILQGFNIGLHDDIYSFGITMWQLKSNTDPYYNIPSNEFVAYHVVKNNLRPDSQLKRVAANNGKENESSGIGLSRNDLVNNKRSGCHANEITMIKRSLTPRTPISGRVPMEFLSTGHNRRHLAVKPSSVSSNVVKKLDFNSVSTANRMSLSSRSVNLSTIKSEMYQSSENIVDGNGMDIFFKDFHQHLSREKEIKIEKSYESIYRQCWQRDAIKRPSSSAVLELLNSTFCLFI